MPASVTWSDDRKTWTRLKRDMEELEQLVVTVGVHGDTGVYQGAKRPITLPELAAIHEFGDRADRIPERSFIRAGIDNNEQEIIGEIDKALIEVVEGKRRPGYVARRAGVLMEGAIKDRIGQGIAPELAARTKKARDSKAKHGGGLAKLKGRYTPLHDTGQLLQSITHKVGTDDGEER